MINTRFNDSKFFADMSHIIQYAEGYLEGIQAGKPVMLSKMGKTIKQLLEEYVDSNARVDPQRLHHVYEWYRTGSPEARLFNITSAVYNGGLTIKSTFSQSRSIANGATTPFYDKASIMESGIPITIKPTRSDVLVFNDNGETIFTRNQVTIDNPGGEAVQGSFADIVDTFFDRYLSQSYLLQSGFSAHLKNPIDFKNNLSKGKVGGKAIGRQIGYNWIVKAGEKL
jgi:hypothetical protein